MADGLGPDQTRCVTRQVRVNTVVVVDDDESIRETICEALRGRRFQVREYGDAEAALEGIREEAPTAVVGDVSLPGMSGIELCEVVQDELGLDAPRFLFVSGLHDEGLIARAFEAGAVEFLCKPFSMGELLAKLQRALASPRKPSIPKLDTQVRRIGGYRVIEEVGRGGMGVIYKARHRETGRMRALKVLSGQECDLENMLRFRREIDLLTGLEHRHLVRLHEAGRSDGLFYYAMEFIEGDTLADRIGRVGPLPIRQAVQITRDVCSALEFLHGHDILHRDIKPSNILLSHRRGAVLADFGLAKHLTDRQLTRSDEMLGTPQFIAPEILLDDKLDHRSDQYSLGMVTLEMLLGEPAIHEDGLQKIFARILEQDFPRAAEITHVPADLAAVVDRMLSLDPKERFDSATDAREALEACRVWRGGAVPG